MTRDLKAKINELHSIAPRGVPITTAWLKQQGISYKLAWWYLKSGWFERIADGVYCFAGDKVTWAGAVTALQNQMQLPIYPGGKTALQLLGQVHYVNMSLSTIQLFTDSTTIPPKWLQAPYWKETFTVYSTSLFTSINTMWLTIHQVNGNILKLSTPEKASLELCYLVPQVVTFAEAAQIIEGLPRMRPKLLQDLLENCTSYKTKRLILYLAEYYQHQWLNEINQGRIDLGKGKRVIAGGGHYNAKYKISVPILKD